MTDAIESLTYSFDWEWGGWGTLAEVPARADARVPASAGRSPTARRRRSTRWRPAACTTSSAAASTATRPTSAGSCRTSRRCSTTTRSWRSPTCTAASSSARRAIARWSRRRSSTCCASSPCRAAGSPRRRTPTPTARRASPSRSRARTGFPTRCCTPSRAAASSSAASSTQTKRAELFELRESRPQPALDDKAVASWNGLALAAFAECGRVLGRADWVETARRLGEFLLGPMSSDGRPSPPHLARGDREGVGLPRGLRRRRERPARAARGDGRAALASGGEPARPPRGRALLRRRVRRLLPGAP